LDVFESRDGRMPKDISPVPLSEFLEDHRKRWVMRTSVGDVVLKRISYLDLERAIMEAEKAYPGYERKSKRAVQLWAVAKAGGLPDVDMGELNDLSMELSAPAKLFSLHCFVLPEIHTLEEFDALLSRLGREERDALQMLLAELSSPSFGERPLSPMLALAQRFGIKLPDDLNVEVVTAGQAAALTKALEKAEGGR
jgi:hypothetical protein